MATIEELITKLPLDQIAARLGVDKETAAAATREASEALVQGMKANADGSGGRRVARQGDRGPCQAGCDKTADDIDVANIDTADGEKIVKNVFGDNEDQVVNQLGGLGGGSNMFARASCRCSPRSFWAISASKQPAVAAVAAVAEAKVKVKVASAT